MIRRLRRKFIAITMLSVFLVLFTLIGIINFANYHNINRSLDLRLDMLEENGGNLDPGKMHAGGRPGQNPPDSKTPPSNGQASDDFSDTREKPEGFPSHSGSHAPGSSVFHDYLHWQDTLFSFDNDLSEEAFFDTRYFTVSIDGSGNISSINATFIASTTEEQARELALSLYQKGRTDGYLDEYKFRAVTGADSEGNPVTMYIFLNAGRELATFHNFLFASFLVSTIGILLILLLVVIFSKIAIGPVAESYDKQKRFITDASHEIKTPLAIIEANTEVIEIENGESEWTKSIRHQISRLSSLTEKLVFLSRMDEESTKPALIDVDLSSAVLETAEGYSGLAVSSGHNLVLSVTPDLTCKGDPSMLAQLVSLLLDNAMKYASEGSDILLTLEAYRKNKYTVRLIMENQTDDISPGNQDILFERFYRNDQSRNSSTGGHGIGLSVASAIVHAHNGSIHAESRDGRSICFTICL